MDTKRQSDRASQGLSEWDYPPGDGAGDGLVFPVGAIYVMSDEQAVTIEGLRRDLATAVAQAGIECEAKHVALNELARTKQALDHELSNGPTAHEYATLKAQLAGAHEMIGHWVAATGCATPEEWEARTRAANADIEQGLREALEDAKRGG